MTLDIIKEIKVKGVENIQEKIVDANSLSKFNSICSELMFARYLAVKKNKKVILFPDNWQGKSPDMESIDTGSDYNVLIEVKLLRDEFSQDESIQSLICWLGELKDRNDIAIRHNPELIDLNKESKNRNDLANRTLECFKSQLDLSKTRDNNNTSIWV